MAQPQVTIILPVHDAQLSIGMTVSSLLSQTYSDFELIAVDDGSTDQSVPLMQAYSDSRLRVLTKKQGGASSARNVGMELAKGRFIAFADDDDYFLPSYLHALMEKALSSEQIVTSNARYLFPGGISPRLLIRPSAFPKPSQQRSTILRANFVSIMSIFPRALVNDIGYFDESLPRVEDWDFWIRAILNGWRVSQQPRPLALINRTQISQSSSVILVAECESAVLRKQLDFPGLQRDEERYIRHRLSVGQPRLLMAAAREAADRGDFAAAAKAHMTATKLVAPGPRARAIARAYRTAPWFIGRVKRQVTKRRESDGLIPPLEIEC